MASGAGPRATGTDGSDFQHWERVASHDQMRSVLFKLTQTFKLFIFYLLWLLSFHSQVTVSQLSLVSHKVVHHPDSLLLLVAAPKQHQLPGFLHNLLRASLHRPADLRLHGDVPGGAAALSARQSLPLHLQLLCCFSHVQLHAWQIYYSKKLLDQRFTSTQDKKSTHLRSRSF
uniref:Uncharacterized protein n=1 Tax=Sparus aurata TaxID=8175 RepID=A0A671WRW8_SPAAU